MRGDQPFSEFTYAFAASHELTLLAPWWSRHVPVIPSLSAEGRLGYDVRFDLPGSFLFIQFKLGKQSENLRLVGDELQPSREAAQLRALAYGGIWQFWTTSHQHRLLSKLAAKFDTTYYFAPKFKTLAELNGHFSKRSIAKSSFIVRANQFPGPRSDNQHRHRVIGPIADPSKLFIFSEPVMVKNLNWSTELVSLARDWPQSPPLGMQLAQLWKEMPGKLQSRERRLNYLRRSILTRPTIFSSDELQLPFKSSSRPQPARDVSGQARRLRIPPWDNAINAYQVESDLGGRAELVAKLLIVADELQSHGITIAVAQPTDRSLQT